MDNGKQIKEDLIKIKNQFLKDKTEYSTDIAKVYDLEDEFNKTRKNKNILYWFVFIVFILIILLGAFFVTQFIQNKTRKIKVSIKEFEDVTLKDILSSTRKYENKIIIAKNELDDLRSMLEEEIETVKLDYKKKLDLKTSKKIAAKEKNKIIKKLKKEQNKKIKEIEDKYNILINEKEEEIVELKNKIDDYDKNKLKEAMDISSEEKLNELQLSRIIDYYEDKILKNKEKNAQRIKKIEDHYNELLKINTEKFNPVFDDKNLLSIIKSPIDIDNTSDLTINDTVYLKYLKKLTDLGITSEDEFNNIINKNKDRDIIADYFYKIPYENNIPDMIKHLDYYDRIIINDYRRMLFNLVDGIDKELKIYIDEVENTIDKSSIGGREYIGYIINPGNINNISIKIDVNIDKDDKLNAVIIDKKNKVIGELLLTNQDNIIKSKIIKLDEDKKLQPFDRIYLKK